jgi:hypothetical protein
MGHVDERAIANSGARFRVTGVCVPTSHRETVADVSFSAAVAQAFIQPKLTDNHALARRTPATPIPDVAALAG